MCECVCRACEQLNNYMIDSTALSVGRLACHSVNYCAYDNEQYVEE